MKLNFRNYEYKVNGQLLLKTVRDFNVPIEKLKTLNGQFICLDRPHWDSLRILTDGGAVIKDLEQKGEGGFARFYGVPKGLLEEKKIELFR